MIPLTSITLTRVRQQVQLNLHFGVYDRLVLSNQSQDILDVFCGSAQIRLQAQQVDVIKFLANTLVIVPTLNTTAVPTAFTLQVQAVRADEEIEAYPQTITSSAATSSGSTSFDTGTLANNGSAALISAVSGKTPFVTFLHAAPVNSTPTVAPTASIGWWWSLLTSVGQRVIAHFANSTFGEPVTLPLGAGLAGDVSDGIDMRNESGASHRLAGVITFNR